MPQFYVVKGIGGGFDGLVVEGTQVLGTQMVTIQKITDRNSIVGDRNVSLPLPPEAVYLGLRFLDPIEDPGIREFAANNPFGKLVLEGHMTCGVLKVAYSQFESVLSVTITDSSVGKTIFSQYFSKDFDKVKGTIESILKTKDDSDAEDLVFQLRELKEAESNG